MSTRKLRLFSALALLGFACVGIGGCGSVSGDLSPEMMTLHERRVDVGNAIDLTFDTNYREFWRDMGEITLLNRPSRLSPAPIPH